MKTGKSHIQSKSSIPTYLRGEALLAGAVVAGALLAAQPAKAFGPTNQVGDIFVIAMENHNLTQPGTVTSPQQILGNAAAPYLNSLMTAGNSNAVQVSYALNYLNAGAGEHPSEPNYVWAEAGSDFGAHTDADPAAAKGNTFYDNSTQLVSQIIAGGNTNVFWHRNHTPHLTGQLSWAGVPWKNYQEDVELGAGPTHSASGTNGPVNPYYGTMQYNYAVKHNPMAFFADSALMNVYPLAQLFSDLGANSVGRFNWITPNQYDDAHSSLSGGFTYNGVHYTGDQSAIATGDNFLSQVVPQIMASEAYKHNGVIIIWWDESEDGDSSGFTIPEIVISPLAKGNAYASTVPLSHSSDLKTEEEIFHLAQVNNPIPASETNAFGGYNNVATVSDLSDLFLPGVIPAPSVSVSYGAFETDPYNAQLEIQKVQITNNGSTVVPGPLELALDNLSTNVTLVNADGTTQILAPLGSPYVKVELGEGLRPTETATVTLRFLNPGAAAITYDGRVLDVTPAP